MMVSIRDKQFLTSMSDSNKQDPILVPPYSITKKSALKVQAIAHIKGAVSTLLKKPTETILLLQFGSAFFKADDHAESDFDVVLVLQFRELKETYPTMTTTDEMRLAFFFDYLAAALESPNCAIFPVRAAKNPILKLHLATKESSPHRLWVDLSFAIVANHTLSIWDGILAEL